jgi:hypothetical protein
MTAGSRWIWCATESSWARGDTTEFSQDVMGVGEGDHTHHLVKQPTGWRVARRTVQPLLRASA